MKQIQFYSELLQQGKLSRREFIGKATALGFTVATATMLADNAANAAGPKKGGTLRQGLTGGGATDTLDPALTAASYMQVVSIGQLRNALTVITPDGELIGELAESWEPSPDAVTWTFKLRQDVEFHNGKTFEAEDVVASINHHRGEDSASGVTGLVAQISDIKADGKNVVVVTLKNGSADFPHLMSDFHLTICPANEDGTMDWQSGLGTGGYALEGFEPGVRTITKRNPNYWKENAAFFDAVETILVTDAAARVSALVTGELDAITDPDLKTLHMLKQNPAVNVVSTFGNRHVSLAMMTDQAPFDNLNLRLALKYTIDRQEMLDKIFKGLGEFGNDHPIGPANIYRATELEVPQREQDLDRARWHLKRSGHDSIDINFHIADTTFEDAVGAGLLFSESAKPLGINLKVVREPDDGYWSNVWNVKPFVGSWWAGRPTEDWIFSQLYASGAEWNETRFSNAAFDSLLIAARVELDPAKRREMYVEMQRIVHNLSGAIIPVFMADTFAVTDKIGLPETIGNNAVLDGHRNAERWWFV